MSVLTLVDESGDQGRAKFSHCCSDMAQAVEDDSMPVVFVPKYREYGLRILDGGTSHKVLEYCPWCGTRLPDSLRHEWFDRLEGLCIDPSDEPYRSSFWMTPGTRLLESDPRARCPTTDQQRQELVAQAR